MQRRGKIEIDPLSFLSEAPRSAETANCLCKQSIAHVEPLRLQRRQVRRETYARTFRALLWSSSASPVVLQRSALRPQRPWSTPLWAAAAWYDILQCRARTAGTYACSFAVPRRPCLQPGKSGYPMDRQAVSREGALPTSNPGRRTSISSDRRCSKCAPQKQPPPRARAQVQALAPPAGSLSPFAAFPWISPDLRAISTSTQSGSNSTQAASQMSGLGAFGASRQRPLSDDGFTAKRVLRRITRPNARQRGTVQAAGRLAGNEVLEAISKRGLASCVSAAATFRSKAQSRAYLPICKALLHDRKQAASSKPGSC